MSKKEDKPNNEPLIIKKYANRRLYNMHNSVYITLQNVRQMVADNISFVVIDAKDDSDITRSILLQIIIDAEQEGAPLFSAKVLEQLIRNYGNSMQSITNEYLEQQLEYLNMLQEQWLMQARNMYGSNFTDEKWIEWLCQNQPLIQNFLKANNDWHKQAFNMFENWQQQNPFLKFFNSLANKV